MKNKRFILFFLLFLLFFYTSFSQNTGGIKGFVKDSTTGGPIPYAIISVLNTKAGTNASLQGSFLLQNIPAGTALIQATAVGYKKTIKSVEIKNDEVVLSNFSLSPEPVEMKSVTKTTDRIKDVYETNISAMALTSEDMKIVPMTAEKDIFRLLEIMPGVTSTGDVTSKFFVRGGSGDQNEILFDNMLIYNPFHALGLFSIFNGDAINVSEIFTGGFGAEYGGSLSSVINIISKEGNRNNFGGSLNVGVLSGQSVFEGPLPAGSFFIAYRKSLFNETLKKFLNKDLPLSFYDLSGKLSFDISSEGKLNLNFISSGDNLSEPTMPEYQWKTFAFGLNLHTFLDNFLTNVSISESDFKVSSTPRANTTDTKSEAEVSNFFLNAKFDYFLKNKDIISYGATILLPRTTYSFVNSGGYLINNSNDIVETDLWLNYKLTQIDEFTLETGARFSFYSYSDNSYSVFEPRISFKYQLLPEIAIKGSYGIYHQVMITTSNEDDLISLFETWIPVSNFPPERADHYILGLDGVFLNNFNYTIQGYYKDFSDILGYNMDKKDKYDPDFSSGTGESYGLEMLAKYNTGDIYGWVSYTLRWAYKTINSQLIVPKYDRRHSLNLIFGAKLPFDINTSLHWEFCSGLPFTPTTGYIDRVDVSNSTDDYFHIPSERYIMLGQKNSDRLPVYHKLDVSISKSISISNFTKLNLSLDINNLYNQKNIFYFDRETNERVNMLPFILSFSLGVEL